MHRDIVALLVLWCGRRGHGFLFGVAPFERRSCLFGRSPRWITCSSTDEMVEGVRHVVQPGYQVAELGAQLRGVSEAICESLQQSGKAVLVDVPRKAPKNTDAPNRIKAMRRPGDEVNFFPEVTEFKEISQLDAWRCTFLEASQHYDVLVLDVNSIVGNDLELTSLSIVREFSALFNECNTIIIKSVGLNLWANRLVHGKRWVDFQGHHEDISPPHVIATVGVHEYRSTIPVTIREGDAVLEVGCHLGTTTNLLHDAVKTSGYAVGVDVGPKIIEGAKSRFENVFFAVGNAWKTAELLRIQDSAVSWLPGSLISRPVGFDVVYVDVGGLSGTDGLLESIMMLNSLMNALEPRCIVIKSKCMRRLSSCLMPCNRLKSKK